MPPLLNLQSEDDFRRHFKVHYLPPVVIRTFDGIHVRFFEANFDHAFFCESVRGSGKKDRLSLQRARRMDWIAAVIGGSGAELYKRAMRNKGVRRIALIPSERYAVVVHVEKGGKRANFVTAYVVGSDEALKKMKSNPKW